MTRPNLLQPVLAAAAYSAVVFLFGFLLGTVRVLAIAPQIGETAAVLLETPIMLGASWIVCGKCVNRFQVGAAIAPRVIMGMGAFAFMMAAELGLSLTLFHRSLAEHLSGYWTVPGAIGLAAQLVFAGFPLFNRAFIDPVKKR